MLEIIETGWEIHITRVGLSEGGLICGMRKTLVERVGLYSSRFDQTKKKTIISSQILLELSEHNKKYCHKFWTHARYIL